jgi:putative MATE family efflux protein
MHQRVHPKTREMNLTEGPILKKLILYALPLIGTNLLQILFNATDVAVLGILVDDYAVGAVGSTNSLINLIIAVFVGLSAGANVVVARLMGAKNEEGAHKAVGTSICIALISGAILLVVGVTCSRYFLQWMKTVPELLDDSTKYMQIYFLGAPIMILYNFIASILRAVGDTLRPLIYLLIGGVLNVGLNIFCIKVLNLTVEGVAIATVAAQFVSVVLSLIALFKSKGYGQFRLKYLKIDKEQFKEILKIGLPSGLQGALFSISNVIIHSYINGFGKETVSASTAASQFDGLIYTTGNAIGLSCMAFVGQNYGAGKIDRIRKVFWNSVFLCIAIMFSMGVLIVLFSDILLKFIVSEPEVIEYAKVRLSVMCFTYFLCGIMECLSYSLRALGKSITAMVISLIGACGFRILWLNTIFLLNPTRAMLFLAWPISWILTIAMYCVIYFPLVKKISKRMPLKIPPKQLESGHITVPQSGTRKKL